ncbi:hypothetical protein [Streptomyces microflavus]|uniref:hypothetical protein n=1 Tax=Streptomyces microflavus TaxID=1919 RepID=UPI002E33C2FB|nr:hypothetical protein [Streptomyces microflavus]
MSLWTLATLLIWAATLGALIVTATKWALFAAVAYWALHLGTHLAIRAIGRRT